jgi:hypothetical protein
MARLHLTASLAALSAALIAASGCSGEIGSSGSPGSAGDTAGPGSGGTGSGPGPGAAGSSPSGAAGNGGPTGVAGGPSGVAGSSNPTGGSNPNGGSNVTGRGGSTSTGAGGGPVIVPPPDALPKEKACSSSVPGPRMLRRLSASEFAASIRTLFNDTANAAPLSTVFSDPVTLGFSVDGSTLLVQELNASQLMDNAEAVASWAASSMSRLTAFGNCSTLDATCAGKFVTAFGTKAFRTKLASSDSRVAAYTKLFMAETSYTAGAQTVITAMLQSPSFLYRTELGTGSGNNFTLTPYEAATNLAYLLTGTMPDDTLLGAADQVAAGSLQLTAMLDQQAARLLSSGDTRSQFAVMTFMNGWLGLDRLYTTAKDGTVFMLTDALRADMATETRSLILEAFNGTGSFGSVLTADHSFLNKNLATFYNLSNASSLGTTFTKVTYTSSMMRDPGLLGNASILIGYSRPDISSPTQRGHMVRTRMLCQDVPPPPANLDTKFQPAGANLTTRQHFEMEHDQGVCSTCHQYMDPIGFGFENYDGFGRYRTTEAGQNIDHTGSLVDVNSAGSVAFSGLSGTGSLSAWLAQSDELKSCMVRYWSYVAYAASSWAQDACTYAAIRQEATTNNYSLKSVLMAIIHAPHFTRRVQDQ